MEISKVQLGIHSNDEEGSNQPKTFVRKRSSLKPRSSIKDPNFKYEELSNKSLKKRITWNATDEQEGEGISPKKSPERSYNDAKTHFVPEFADKDDLYLQKLNEINKIEATPEVIEEIRELAENSDNDENESDLMAKLRIEDKSQEKAYEEITAHNKNPAQKRRSLKDEFSLIKNIKSVEEEELSPETIAETMKNTLYNKVVGKIAEDE